MGVAERLVIERKRLGLSQAEFARQAGVSLSSQKRYEKGERKPDFDYIEVIESIGVDTYYVTFGSRLGDYSDRYTAIEFFLIELSEALGFGRDGFNDQLDKLEPIVKTATETDDTTELQALTTSLVESIFANSPRLAPSWQETSEELSFSDCANIVEKFEAAQIALGKAVSPPKKAQSIAMLWRVLRSGGKVDETMIEEAVKLAAI
jgi:transcriptional regulator with XRE-family HTH domain